MISSRRREGIAERDGKVRGESYCVFLLLKHHANREKNASSLVSCRRPTSLLTNGRTPRHEQMQEEPISSQCSCLYGVRMLSHMTCVYLRIAAGCIKLLVLHSA